MPPATERTVEVSSPAMNEKVLLAKATAAKTAASASASPSPNETNPQAPATAVEEYVRIPSHVTNLTNGVNLKAALAAHSSNPMASSITSVSIWHTMTVSSIQHECSYKVYDGKEWNTEDASKLLIGTDTPKLKTAMGYGVMGESVNTFPVSARENAMPVLFFDSSLEQTLKESQAALDGFVSNLKVGDNIDAADGSTITVKIPPLPSTLVVTNEEKEVILPKWYLGTVVEVGEGKLKVRFKGYGKGYDKWYHTSSSAVREVSE